GAFVTEVDLYATTEVVQTPVFTADRLAHGPHTLAIESTGRKRGGDQCSPSPPDCAADYAVVVDAFDVGSEPPPTTGTRTEETMQAVNYTADWTQDDKNKSPKIKVKTWSGDAAL